MAGDEAVRHGLLLLTGLLLVTSCSSTAKRGSPAPQDVSYNEAMEFYTLVYERPGYLDALWEKQRAGTSSEAEMETLRRYVQLEDAIEAWPKGTPDARVVARDRKDINGIIEQLFEDPASRAQMVLKTYDLDVCERVVVQFFNRNRCFVSVLFYDRGPTVQAGVNVYLFTREGKWTILHRSDWILVAGSPSRPKRAS